MDKACNVLPRRPSATDLILDLLVTQGAALSAKAITQAAALFGIGENAVRVCLSRLIAADKIERPERSLYRAKLQTTGLAHTVDGWYQREALRKQWSGDWLAVQDSAVSRTDKSAWRRHQRALGLKGFASLSGHLHLRPDNLMQPFEEFQNELVAMGIAPESCLMRVRQLDAAHESKARSLWNTRALESAHRHWISMIESSDARLHQLPLPSAVRESLLLGRSAIAHVLRDPLLPEELMPSQTRQELRQRLYSYQQRAIALWRLWLEQQETALARTHSGGSAYTGAL